MAAPSNIIIKINKAAIGENYFIPYGQGTYYNDANFFPSNYLGDNMGKDLLMVLIQPVISILFGTSALVLSTLFLLFVAPFISIIDLDIEPLTFSGQAFLISLIILGCGIISPLCRIFNIFTRVITDPTHADDDHPHDGLLNHDNDALVEAEQNQNKLPKETLSRLKKLGFFVEPNPEENLNDCPQDEKTLNDPLIPS